MRMKIYLLIVLFLSISTQAFCQTTNYDLFITFNGNLYLPSNNADKGVYPILGYDKKTDPKLLIGGFGVGISGFKLLKNKLSLKGQANLSKHTYWDEPGMFTDETGNNVLPFFSGSSDYSIGITATLHYFFTQKFSVGTGVGGQILLLSLSRLPETNDNKKLIAVNRYYKPLLPTLPVELSYKSPKNLFNIRYEYGLLNRFKGDLKNSKIDKFGLLTFEIGFNLKD